MVQVPVALDYWMDESQRAYALEALHQRLNNEMGMRGFRVDSVRTETGVVLDPIDPDAELLSLNEPVDESNACRFNATRAPQSCWAV